MTLRDLIERRSAIASEMRALNDAPEGDNGDLSDGQESRFSALRSEMETIERRITRQEQLDAAERRMAGSPASSGGDDFVREIRGLSIVRAIAGAAGLKVDDGREREIAVEIARREQRSVDGIAIPLAALALERRTVSATAPVGGPGSALIATDHSGEVIDRLRANMAASRLGVRVLTGLRGDLETPKLTKSSTAAWFFAQSALAWWASKLEAEFARSVFSERERAEYEIDFDMSGLLRGDPETRWASHKIAIETGVLDPDEVRELEGWNPLRPGGSPARAA
jgi:HK97 family phage major capsid protein